MIWTLFFVMVAEESLEVAKDQQHIPLIQSILFQHNFAARYVAYLQDPRQAWWAGCFWRSNSGLSMWQKHRCFLPETWCFTVFMLCGVTVLLVINHWELCRILPLRLAQEYIALTLWIKVLRGYLKKAQAFFVSLELKKIHRKNGGNANSLKGSKSKQHEHKSVSVTTIVSIIKERLWFYSSLKNNNNPCSIQKIGLLLC